MKKFAIVATISVLVSLSGCALTAKSNARNEMEQSKTAYKTCLAQNPNKPSTCDAAKAAYEADVKAYEAMSKSTPPPTIYVGGATNNTSGGYNQQLQDIQDQQNSQWMQQQQWQQQQQFNQMVNQQQQWLQQQPMR